jgi:urea carboxylase
MSDQFLRSDASGIVLEVTAPNGTLVQEGDTIVLVESMKMEIPVFAPLAGRVAGLTLAPGDEVQEGAKLGRIEP